MKIVIKDDNDGNDVNNDDCGKNNNDYDSYGVSN